MNKEEKLKARLEAIQELKSRYYIGTSEAKDYLDAFISVEEKPMQLADMINRELPSNATYHATPERLVGFIDLFSSIFNFRDHLSIQQEIQGFKLGVFSRIIRSFYPIRIFERTYKSGIGGEIPEEEFNNLLINLYKRANEACVKDDSRYIEKSMEFLIGEIENEIRNLSDSDLKEMIELCELTGFDRKRLYSTLESVLVSSRERLKNFSFTKESLMERKNEFLEYKNIHHINYGTILDRIIRDQVENRLEYQRQVITLYAEASADFNETGKVEDLYNGVKYHLKKAEQNHAKLVEYRAPEQLILTLDNLRKRNRTLLRMIVDDKNFLNRFLKN